MTHASRSARRHAVLVRTHFWDAFAARQFARLAAHAHGTDVFVLVDETHGPVEGISHDRVLRVTEQDMLDMGLPRAGTGGMLWFNGDYPLYRFGQLFPEYDLILQLEYDAVLNLPAADLLAQIEARDLDFIGLTKGDPPARWHWRQTCADAYPDGRFTHQLICVSAFSRRALGMLYRRRLDHAAALRAGRLRHWPICEAFIPTEIDRNGLARAELSEFANTEAYDHWPPYLERDLPGLAGHGVVHPVLDPDRYVASLLKYRVGLAGYAWPFSRFHRKLRRLPPRRYVRALAGTFADKAARNLRRALNPRRAA